MDKQIDEICDRFEAAWKSGEEPSLRAAIESIPEEERSALANVLIPLDVECRAQFATASDACDYVMYGDVAVDAAAVALRCVKYRLRERKDQNRQAMTKRSFKQTVNDSEMMKLTGGQTTRATRFKSRNPAKRQPSSVTMN